MANNQRVIVATFVIDCDNGAAADEYAELLIGELQCQPDLLVEHCGEADSDVDESGDPKRTEGNEDARITGRLGGVAMWSAGVTVVTP